MLRTFMRSKIHQARVTDANLNYVGSITIDEDIMEAVGISENEKVQVVNNNNGERIETYVIRGERGSKMICLNGAAARRFQIGDTVIIIAYGLVKEEEIALHQPKIVILDETNDMVEERSKEIAGTFV
ncbi:MAG TPA: aspartate 1-decarboxylase [Candidatus Angelobacter sp.]|nr:aspartate 1-decarboxylase [Candidatus Angelobacter sp.]